MFGAPAENRRNAFGETDLIHEKVHGEDLVWGPGNRRTFPYPFARAGPPVGGPGGGNTITCTSCFLLVVYVVFLVFVLCSMCSVSCVVYRWGRGGSWAYFSPVNRGHNYKNNTT